MKIVWLGFKPAIVLYSNWLVPKRYAGRVFLMLVLIRKCRSGNEGVLQHELTHVKQFYRNPLWPILYMVSVKKRLKYEAEAYGAQAHYSKTPTKAIEEYATSLCEQYGITETKSRVEDMIWREYWKV